MKKLKSFATKFQNGLMMKMAGVTSVKETETEKGDHLLEVLGTIIIAVVILILFKDSITSIFKNALGQTTNSVNGLFTNVSNT